MRGCVGACVRVWKGVGVALHRSSVRASHSAAPGLMLPRLIDGTPLSVEKLEYVDRTI